jgi:hypothetical protein
VKLIVFLSAGRCGTQLFRTYLGEAAGARAVVEHEPLGARYEPKNALRAPDLDLLLRSHPAVQRHFDEISRTTETGKMYVETGWPVFPWIPWLLRHFGDEAFVVHLVRNPVRYAFSLASHGYFAQRQVDSRYFRLAQLEPTDPGVKHHEYGPDWETLNPVEKCLFQWLEINAWAEELKALHPEHFLTVRSEDVLARPGLLIERLIERRPELAHVFQSPSASPGLVDKWQRGIRFEVKSLRYSPEVVELGERYGYSMDVDENDIVTRFFGQ